MFQGLEECLWGKLEVQGLIGDTVEHWGVGWRLCARVWLERF